VSYRCATVSNYKKTISRIKEVIEQTGRKTLREYLKIENAFLVEGFLALGAAIGICLVAAIVRGGW